MRFRLEMEKVLIELRKCWWGLMRKTSWCSYPCLTIIERERKKRKRRSEFFHQSRKQRKENVINNHLLWLIYWQRNLWQVEFFHDARCDHIRKDLVRSLRIACVHSYHILLDWVSVYRDQRINSKKGAAWDGLMSGFNDSRWDEGQKKCFRSVRPC